jgi:hypothetical protein
MEEKAAQTLFFSSKSAVCLSVIAYFWGGGDFLIC